jgi:isopenicillin-N epimerase
MTSINFKSLFLLDPNIVFLNHGSFGACPEEVFHVYQEWQGRLENQPVRFMGREYAQHDRFARESLGHFLNTDPDDIAFIPNATHGVNLVARSLPFQPGDEILTIDHEYGACDYTWEFMCEKSGAKYIRSHLPIPVVDENELVETIWQGVTPRTRLIYLSHITSPSALRIPVETLCARAQEAGILTMIDGAHAPGQIPLDLTSLNADFYTGNCHKWMLSPKGAAFLYSRHTLQHLIEPLVVSWGFHTGVSSGSRYIDYLQWSGTRDPAAYFSVPAAINFMNKHGWDVVQKNCHSLLKETLEQISQVTGLPPIYPLDSNLYHQMGVVPLPSNDPTLFKSRLYDEFAIEVPLTKIGDQNLIRVSIQAYNTPQDCQRLIDALKCLILGGTL